MTTKKTTKRVAKKELSFQERVNAAYKEEIKIYQKAGISKTPYIEFKDHKKVPLLAAVCIKLITIMGGRFNTKFVDVTKK